MFRGISCFLRPLSSMYLQGQFVKESWVKGTRERGGLFGRVCFVVRARISRGGMLAFLRGDPDIRFLDGSV